MLLPINPDSSTPPIQRHGSSRVAPSSRQRTLRREIHELAHGAFTPLFELDGKTLHPDRIAEIATLFAALRDKSDGWMVTFNEEPRERSTRPPTKPKEETKEKKRKTVHLIEDLLEIDWTSAKKVWATIPDRKRTPATLRDYTREIHIPWALLSLGVAHLNGTLPKSPDLFLAELQKWVATLGADSIRSTRRIRSTSYSTPVAEENSRHRALALAFRASNILHRACELLEEHTTLRERTSYVMEAYRYGNDVFTRGIPLTVLDFANKRNRFLECPDGQDRKFRSKLYTDERFPLLHLVPDVEGLHASTELRELCPKLDRLVRYAKKTMNSITAPSSLIVTADGNAATDYIGYLLAEDKRTADRSGRVVKSHTSKKFRDAVFDNLADGTYDYLVCSELASIPVRKFSKPITLAATNNHATVMKLYPLSDQLFAAGNSVKVVNFVTLGSSDSFRRKRVTTRLEVGDALIEVSITLSNAIQREIRNPSPSREVLETRKDALVAALNTIRESIRGTKKLASYDAALTTHLKERLDSLPLIAEAGGENGLSELGQRKLLGRLRLLFRLGEGE